MPRRPLVALLVGALAAAGCGGPEPLTQVGVTTVAGPRAAPVPVAAGATSGALSAWAQQNATAAVPARAVQAYGEAELELRALVPGCGLSWTTLAGIGTVESASGTLGGAVLGADGTSSPRIRGPVLDGTSDNAAIGDTDGGRLDGLDTIDRAVGPLQFIPGTWATWGSDGDGDGRTDPDDLDDAAVAAGRYLCEAGGDLTTPQGWTDAVFAYNHSDAYVTSVRDAAEAAAS